jgi:hypothetical protein
VGQLLRRLRGAIGNAVVWAAGWFVAGIGITAGLFATGSIAGVPFWTAALVISKAVAAVGFFMGGGFSLYLGIAGRNHTLDELNAWRLSVRTAGLAAVGITIFAVLGSGVGSLSLGVLATVAGVVGGLAGATAYTTLKIAQSGLPEGQARAELAAGR